MGKTVDLVYYDENGKRHVIGEAVVETDEAGNMVVDAEVKAPTSLFHDPGAAYSIADQPSHVTKNNPTGEVRQCDRRDLHGPHEWQPEFGGYFDVYCPGNNGKTR